jgi:hypothetical protein
LCLDVDNLFGVLLPVAGTFVFFLCYGLYFFAELCLPGQVFFLLRANVLEVLLVLFVDDSRSCLEAGPDFFAQFLAYRAGLTEFLMQFLQLVESTDDIFFLVELLCSLA